MPKEDLNALCGNANFFPKRRSNYRSLISLQTGTGHPSSFTCPCRDWHRGLPRRSRLRGGAGSHVEEARPLGHALVHSTNSSAHAPCVAGSAPDSDATGTCGGKCPGSNISKSNSRAGPEPLHVRQPDALLPSGANPHGPLFQRQPHLHGAHFVLLSMAVIA